MDSKKIQELKRAVSDVAELIAPVNDLVAQLNNALESGDTSFTMDAKRWVKVLEEFEDDEFIKVGFLADTIRDLPLPPPQPKPWGENERYRLVSDSTPPNALQFTSCGQKFWLRPNGEEG